MNFSINNLNGTNANISSMISQLVAKKSSSLSTLMQQSNSLQSSIAALKNQSTGGSINSSYSSQISSLQDAIDRLNTQYTINENKLSTVNSLNNSYKKTVSTLDDYINSLKNPTNVSETINASSSNSSVADVTLNGTADVQSHNLKVTQLATCSTLTSAKIKGGAVSGTTKIVDLFSGSYNSTTNTITSIRTDLRGDMKLSDVGITSGAFKLGSRVIRISEDETVDDLLAKINADSNYLAGIDENTGAFTIQGLNGSSIGITNAVGDLSVSGNIAMDTKLADIGIKTGAYFVGDAQIDVTAGDTVATLIDKIESTGYRAELVTDVSNPSGKVLSITDEGGNAVDASATNFASLAGFTVSDGTFSINGTEFNIDTNTTINDLVHSINAATTDNVGAEFKNGKIVLTASETGAIDISVEKGTSNFTNAIGFTQGGVMYTGNYVVGSEGSCATLTGVKNTVNSSDYAGGLTGTNTIKAEYMTLEEAQAQGYTIINTAEEFVNSINASLTGKFYLNADLTIDSSMHGSISEFSGTLEGNGHTITYTGESALLGKASESFDVVVRNLNIANSSVSSTDADISKGLLFNTSYASSLTIDNVNIFDSTIDTNRRNVGALIGYVREGSVDISNVDIDGLTINAYAGLSSYVGSLIGCVDSYVSALNINNVEALNLDINYPGTVSSSCVGGLIGNSGSTSGKYFSDIYLQGSIDAGVGSGYALAAIHGSAYAFTNNVYFDFDEDLAITYSYDASMNPVSTYPTPTGLATIPNYGVKEEALTQVSVGTIEINGKTISISAGTIAGAIDEINAQSDETGVEALVVDGKLQLKATTEGGKVSVGDCTSNLKTVAGLDGKSFSTGSFVLSYSKIDEYGNATSEMLSTEIIVEDGDTVDDIINKIKTQTLQAWTDSEGVEQTNYWQGQITDGKFQLIQSDKGAGFKINVVSGTSDFTSYVGLTTEVVHGNAISGTSTTYTGANGVDLSDAFTQGTFSITASKANDPSTTETVTINVDEGETLESVIEKINSSGLAITASLVEHTDGTQRLQLTHNNQGAGYKISANSGSSNFTEAVGFTSSVSIGVAGDGDNSSLTGVTSGLTLADTGYTEGSFIVKASKISSDGTVASSEMATVEINVTSDMTLEDVLNQISSATYVDENGDEVDLGLRASLNADGKIVIEQAYAGEGFDIEVVGGSTNFTESVGLTAQVNAGVTTLGQNAQLVGETSFTVTNKSEDGTTFDDGYSFDEGTFVITTTGLTATAGPNTNTSQFVMGTETTYSTIRGSSVTVENSPEKYSSLTGTNTIKTEYMTLEEAQAQGYTIINTAEEFISSIRANYSGKFYLNADLTIDQSVHGYIDNFGGTLEGNGHTITYTGTSSLFDNVGSIGHDLSISITNLTLENCNVTGASAILIGDVYKNTTLGNINIINSSMELSGGNAGALVGTRSLGDLTLYDIDVSGLTITQPSSSQVNVGSLIGYVQGSDSVSLDNIEILDLDMDITTDSNIADIGGVIGGVALNPDSGETAHTLSSIRCSGLYVDGSIQNYGTGRATVGDFCGTDCTGLSLFKCYFNIAESYGITSGVTPSVTPTGYIEVYSNNEDDDVEERAAAEITNFGVVNETITQITAGSFEINGVAINLSGGDINDAIDEINARKAETGVEALVVDGKLQLKSTTAGNNTIYINGDTTNFSTVTGLLSGTIDTATLDTGSMILKYAEIDAEGNFTGEMLTAKINVDLSDDISDVSEKIKSATTQTWTDNLGNEQTTFWTGSIVGGQFVLTCNQKGAGNELYIIEDTSGFTEYVGIDTYNVDIQAGSEKRTVINVEQGDSLQDVVNKINSANIGIIAYIDDNDKLKLEALYADPDFKIEVESATSDFLFRAGLTSEITNVAQIQYGTEEVQFSSLTGTNNIKAEYMTLEEAQAQGYTIINTAEEFVNSINASPIGKFYLNADLTIDSSVHGSISSFSGTLEGNGHTITYTGESALLGRAYRDSVVVRNLNIANSSVSSTVGTQPKGLLFYWSDVHLTIDNVNIFDSTIDTNRASVGALIGSVTAGRVTISNVDIDGLTINASDHGFTAYVGSLIGSVSSGVSALNINNVEALNLDINYTATVSSSCVGGLIGYSEYISDSCFSDIYLQGSIDAGIGQGYALGALHGNVNNFTNNVYLDFDEALDITRSYSASMNPVYTNFNSDDLKSSASGHMSLGVKNETFTQITAGSFEINGVTINLSGGDINDAIDVINSHSEETGVKALVVDGKLQLKATKTGNQTIYIDGGTSNFGEVTGLTTKAQGGGTALGTEAKLHSFTGSKNVVSEYMSVEEAQAQGYTIINTAEEFISKINASPSGNFYLNSDLTIDADIHGRIGANFAGTIEGNGHKITYTSENGGLFSVALGGASFNNLTLSGDVSKTSDMCGALVEYSMGTMFLRNVNTDALNVSGQGNVGLLVGSAETLHIINSDISNSSVSGTNALGLVGTIATELNLEDSYIGNDVNITANSGWAAGVVGQTTSTGAAARITLTNTYLGADLSSTAGSTFAICGKSCKSTTTTLNDSYINCKATGLYSSASSSTCESNNTYCNEDIDTYGSILSYYAVDGISVEAMYQQHCDSSKFVDEGLTYISAGTVVINGTTINLTQGSITSAIEQINAKTSQTGVTAQILDGKVKLSSLSAFSVQEGTSDFVEKTGTAGYTTANVTESELISGMKGFYSPISSAQITSTEQAEALGYTAVTTADELITALSEQKDIVLLANIDFSGVSFSSITYHGILDGNGYTISNLSRTLISETDGATTVKNLEFSNCYATSRSLIVGEHLSWNSSSQALTFENIKITDSSLTTGDRDAGFLVRESYGFTTFNDIVLSNCDLNHTRTVFTTGDPASSVSCNVGLLGGYMGAGVSVDGVTVDSQSSISVANFGHVGGLFGFVNSTYACSGLMSSIDNVSIEAKIRADKQCTYDYNYIAKFGGLVGFAQNLLVKDSYVGTTFTKNYSVQSNSIYVGDNDYTDITISNSYHKNFVTGLSETISGSSVVASKPTSVTGGEFTQGTFKTQLRESEAIAKGYTVIKTASEFVEKITANTSGKFMLMNDIDLSGVTGLDSLTFTGELHGNGYTLRNYTSTNAGLFEIIDDATIKNLNIDNFETSGGTLAAGGKGNLDIENIKITNSAVDSGTAAAGALVGTYGFDTVAGLATTIDNVRVTDTTVSGGNAGGLIGVINSTQTNIRVTNSYIDAEVTGTTSVGGVVGIALSPSQHYENIYIGGTLNLNGTTELLSAVVGRVNGTTKAVYTSRLIIDAIALRNGGYVVAPAISYNSCSGEIVAESNIYGSNWNVLYTGGSATTTTSSGSIQSVLASRKDIGVSVYNLLSEGTLTVKGAGGTSTINIKEGWNLQQLADAVNNSSSGVKIVVREDGYYSFECFSEINVSEENKYKLLSTYEKGIDIKPVRYYSSVSGLSENSKIEGLTSGTFSIKLNYGELAGGVSEIFTVNIDETATIGQIIDDINDAIGVVDCGLDADGRLYFDFDFMLRAFSGGGSIEFLEGSSNFDSLFFKADTIQNTATSGTQAALVGSVNIDGSETLLSGEVVISAGNVSQSFTYNAGESVDDVIQKINNSSLGVTASIYNGKLLLVNNDMQDSDNISVEEVSGNFGAITGTTTITPQQGVSIVGHAGSATTLTGSKTINNIMTIDDAREAGFTIVENQTQLKNAISNNDDIYLARDIFISDASVLGLNYSGTFEGGGNAITSTIVSSKGLFNELCDATIRNVNLTDFRISLSYRDNIGVLSGYSDGDTLVENVRVSSSSISGECYNAAGLIGTHGDGVLTVNNVKIDGVQFDCSSDKAAGICSYLSGGTLYVDNVDISCSASNSCDLNIGIGGVFGSARETEISVNNANIKLTSYGASDVYSLGYLSGSNLLADNIWIDNTYSANDKYLDMDSDSSFNINNANVISDTSLAIDGFDYNVYSAIEFDLLKQSFYKEVVPQITAGTVNINGSDVTLSGGSLNEALYEINQQTATTGVRASIVNNKVVLENIEYNNNAISVTAGTSNFVAVTGVAGYEVPETVLPTHTGGMVKGDNAIQGTHYTKEEAEAMGYVWVTSASQFSDFSYSGATNVKVMLGCDIDLSSFAGGSYALNNVAIFDGNGYTIKNYTGTTSLFINGYDYLQDLTVKNLKIDNFEVQSTETGTVGAFLDSTTKSIKFENVEVTNTSVEATQANSVGLLVGSVTGLNNDSPATVNFSNVLVKNSNIGFSETDSRVGGLVGNITTNGIVSANNVLIDGFSIEGGNTHSEGAGSMFGYVNGTLIISASEVVNGSITLSADSYAAGVIGKFDSTQDASYTYSSTQSCKLYNVRASVDFNESGLFAQVIGSSTGSVQSFQVFYNSDMATGATERGSTSDFSTVWHTFDENWSAKGVAKTASKAIKEGYTCIYTADEFVSSINANKSGKFMLMNDIDMSGIDLGSGITDFAGILDGNGYTIKNYTSDNGGALFYSASGSVIFKNLTLDNFTIDKSSGSGTNYSAALLSTTSTDSILIENVTLQNSSIESSSRAAGLFAYVSSSAVNVNNVNIADSVSITATDSSSYVGGIVAYASSDAFLGFSNSESSADLTSARLVGQVVGYGGSLTLIDNVKLAGTVSAAYAASVAGCFLGDTTKIVKNSYMESTVDGTTTEGVFSAYTNITPFWSINCAYDSSNMSGLNTKETSAKRGDVSALTDTKFEAAVSSVTFKEDYYTMVSDSMITVTAFDYLSTNRNYSLAIHIKAGSIQSAVDQINQSLQSCLVLKVTAYIDSNNKIAFATTDSRARAVMVSDGYGDFFDIAINDSDVTVNGSFASIQWGIRGLTLDTTLGDLSGDQFIEGYINETELYNASTTIGDIISVVDSELCKMSLDSEGRVVIKGNSTQIINGFDEQLHTLLGYYGTVADNSVTDLGEEAVNSTLTGTKDVSLTDSVAVGDFRLNCAGEVTTYTVTEGMTVADVLNMINRDDPNLSVELIDNKVHFTDVNELYGRITIIDGTSNFAEMAGFTIGNEQAVSLSIGNNNKIVSQNTVASAEGKYTTGTFSVNLTDMAGNITATETFTITKSDTIDSILAKISNSALDVTVEIDGEGKVAIQRKDSTDAGLITITKGTSDFTNVIGFTQGGVQSVDLDEGCVAKITSTNTVFNKVFTEGNFVIDILDTNENIVDSHNISVSTGDTVQDVCNRINNMKIGVNAYIDTNTNKLVLERNNNAGEGYLQIRKGTSDFTNVLGLTSGGACSADFEDGISASLTAKYSAFSSQRFTEGDFVIKLTGENEAHISVDVTSTDSVYSIANKINDMDSGVHAYVDNNAKLVIVRDADSGIGGLEVISGTSSITDDLGFTSGGQELPGLSKNGSVSKIVSTLNYITVGDSYSAGDFYIQLLDKNGNSIDGGLITVNIAETNGVVDDIYQVIKTINDKDAGVTASFDSEGRLVIQKAQDADAGSFVILKGSSDFTDKFGITSGGATIDDTFVSGTDETQSVLTSNDLSSKLASDSSTLGTIGVTDGTFKVNGVNIAVRSTDTVSDLATRISAECSDMGITASYINGQLVIRNADPKTPLCVEKGSSNFTVVSGLTGEYQNSVDLDATVQGNYAKFTLDGETHEMALSLNENGENILYLDAEGNVVTSAEDATLTVNIKKTGSTVIEVGKQLLNDSVEKLQTFVNRFNSAMKASGNHILADDTAFRALLNKINNALTMRVGSYYDVASELEQIGISIGLNSDGTLQMSLSKSGGEYDYVNAFYQDSNKVMDLLIGDDSEPLDFSVAGVFTRLSSVLHEALEDTRSGYFKVTPRSIQAQQKALKNEITSLTFDLNELKTSVGGTGDGYGVGANSTNDAYIALLEAQYQMLNQAISDLNSQYNSSLVRLILNQNNSSFSPMVS